MAAPGAFETSCFEWCKINNFAAYTDIKHDLKRSVLELIN